MTWGPLYNPPTNLLITKLNKTDEIEKATGTSVAGETELFLPSIKDNRGMRQCTKVTSLFPNSKKTIESLRKKSALFCLFLKKIAKNY